MKITIDISPEVEQELRNAAAQGDRPRMERTLVAALRPTVDALLDAPPDELTYEEFEALADQLAEEFEAALGPGAPILSDEAISRAGIYGDHP